MFRYALKRVFRGYRLFIALTIGVLIATTFFASMMVSADVLSKEALKETLRDIDYDGRIVANNVTWTPTDYDNLESIIDGLVEVNNTDRYSKMTFMYNQSLRQSFDIVGIERDSRVWNTLEYINGTTDLATNQTYVVASSENASLLTIGQTLHVPIVLKTTTIPFYRTIYLNLTVAGFVDIPSRASRLLNPPMTVNLGLVEIEIGDWRKYNLLIVDWALTIRPILEWYSTQNNVTQLMMTQGLFLELNRDLLINPYDIGVSSTNVGNALAKIEDRTAVYNTEVYNLIGSTLAMMSLLAGVLVLSYVALAAPIIFMSWYSSTMLSDVSYNLRRREFGLLQTKGFGPRSIKSMLVFEGIIIGVFGGLSGLILGTVIAHLIVGVPIETPFIVLATSPINAIVAVIFGGILGWWSVRGPSDRASKLEPLDSLKQYIYVEEQREYRRLLPTIALLLGTYKIVVWMLGIDMQVLLATALSTNFILLIAVALWTPVDSLLNFVGPIFFLYGVTKILLRGSQKFQQWVVTAGKRFFGAFGGLATRNVQRNPSRNAALVFVIALIVSYGIATIGDLYSEEDRVYRTTMFTVGSDVSAILPSDTNLTQLELDLAGLDGVLSQTIEYHITLGTTRGALATRGINSSEWLQSAFYESAWFSGCVFPDILKNFSGHKILLSVVVARALELRVGNNITVKHPVTGKPYPMNIVGLVGYTSPLEDLIGQFAFSGDYPSFVPVDFLNTTGLFDYSEMHLLIKTVPGVNGTLVEENIRTIVPSVKSTDSVTSRLKARTESEFEMGGIRARWLGVAFAGVLAVMGTGLVVGLTLREKEYETTLLQVRGFTRSQTLKVLIAEIMVMVMFSLLLGSGTGIIQLFGTISNSSQNTQSLVRPRVLLDVVPMLLSVGLVGVVFVSALIPVLFTVRFNERKIDVLRE